MQTLIENVNIINPNDEFKDNQNILIEGKYIKEVSSSKIHTKENVRVIDGDNNYVLPGSLTVILIFWLKAFTRKKIWLTL